MRSRSVVLLLLLTAVVAVLCDVDLVASGDVDDDDGEGEGEGEYYVVGEQVDLSDKEKDPVIVVVEGDRGDDDDDEGEEGDDDDYDEEALYRQTPNEGGAKVEEGGATGASGAAQQKKTLVYEGELAEHAEYDADEFEGFPQKAEQVRPSSPKTKKQREQQQQPQRKPIKLTILEASYLGFLLVYGIVFFIGKRQNDAIAFAWHKEFEDLLKSNFAQVGDSIPALSRESFNSFVLYASGRVNCFNARFTLDLRRRQDLFSRVLDFLWISRDTIAIDIMMNPAVMPPIVFGLCLRRDEKTMKELPDMARFTKTGKGNRFGIPESYSLLYEHSDIVESILTPEMKQLLNGNLVQQIYISDQNSTVTTHKCLLRLVLRLPAANRMQSLQPQMLHAMQMIDLLSVMILPKPVLQKNEQERARLADEIARKDLAERLEAEKKQKEEQLQKDLEKMTPKEREKKEEKDRRKQAKAAKPKFKILKS
ncbi:DUF1682 family protein [Pelomyxa schiedti]|nr:DUF1682 family protein [Pelomyxa schiedti]